MNSRTTPDPEQGIKPTGIKDTQNNIILNTDCPTAQYNPLNTDQQHSLNNVHYKRTQPTFHQYAGSTTKPAGIKDHQETRLLNMRITANLTKVVKYETPFFIEQRSPQLNTNDTPLVSNSFGPATDLDLLSPPEGGLTWNDNL